MALYGVVAGIHGNAEALGAVLVALERRGATRVLCLGDIVGYNADPDECVSMLRRRRATCVAGKHDLVATGRLDLERFPNRTLHSLRRTRRSLSAEAAQWLGGLPVVHALDERIVLVHGGVRDPLEYMTAPRDLKLNAGFLAQDFPEARVCFFGNSHAQKVHEVEAGEARLRFINPGAVDGQRRRDHRLAECAIFDSLDGSVEFLRVRYDAAATEAKAAVFGYRINGLADGWYGFQRGLRRSVLLRRGASPARAGRAA